MRVVVSTLVMFRYSKPHPSWPSTRRFQITAALSDTDVRVCFLASFFCSETLLLAVLRNVWTFLLVLVLPLFWLALWCSFAHHVALAWIAKRDEAHVKDANTRCLEDNTHTRVHHEDISQTRKNPDHSPHTEALCCVFCSNFIGNRIMDRTYVGMALTRLLQTLPRLPLRPTYSVGKTRRTASQLIADW